MVVLKLEHNWDVFILYNDILRNNAVGNIKYRNTVIAGEVTAVHNNGTYDVKLAGEDSAYPNIPTIFINPSFGVGEMVGVVFEGGNMEMPKIVGGAKKIAQTTNSITFNYV